MTLYRPLVSAGVLAVAPMASHGLAHPDAEAAMARAAAAAGIPFTLSTMSNRSIEEVAAAATSLQGQAGRLTQTVASFHVTA